MTDPIKLTRKDLFDRFEINDTDLTILDTQTNLMWMSKLVSGSWSTHSDGSDEPDGSLFSEDIWNVNNNPEDKVLPPVLVGHSETGKFVDNFGSKNVTIPGGGTPKKYTDWRLPDIEEMVEFQTYFGHIWGDDYVGDGERDAKFISVEGKTFQSRDYFWTSTLLRVHGHEVDEAVHQAWAVAETDKAYEENPKFLAESASERSSAYRPLLKPVVKVFATTTALVARLVRVAG